MTTQFFKMTGSGNDFVMLDGRKSSVGDWTTERIVAACDRRTGIGADGLVILEPDGDASVRMQCRRLAGGDVWQRGPLQLGPRAPPGHGT